MVASEENEDIIVVGKVTDDNKAVWDRHPQHPANYEQPAGEVFISDMRPYNVFRSPGISQKIGEKALREIGSGAATRRLDEHTAKVEEQAKLREELLANQQANAVLIAPASAPVAPLAPAATVQAEPNITTPASQLHDGEAEDDGEEEGSIEQSQTSGTTLARPARSTRRTGGSETPPER